MRKPKLQIVHKCDRCGADQPKDEKQSNENWHVFKVGEKCKCGGEFKMDVEELQILPK